MGIHDSLRLCSTLGISSSLAYQYSSPPPPDAIFNTLVEYTTYKTLEIDNYYYTLYYGEIQKENFIFIFRNERFKAQNSFSDRLRLALVLNCITQIKLFLSDDQLTNLNSYFIYGCSNQEIVKLFLSDSRFDPSQNGLIISINMGLLDTAKLLLLDQRIDPSADNNFALRMAVDLGYLDFVELLLKHPKVDPSDLENSALITSCSRGFTNILKVLLSDSRIDPSAEGNEAIIVAASRGHLEIVKLLLSDSRVNPASRRNRALNRALEFGHEDIVQVLLSDSRVVKKGNKSRLLASKKY